MGILGELLGKTTREWHRPSTRRGGAKGEKRQNIYATSYVLSRKHYSYFCNMVIQREGEAV